MTSRRALLMVAAAAATLPRPSRAQARVRRIGYLVLSPLVDPPTAERAAFLAAMRELGYVQGQNLEIEYRSAENEAEFLPQLVAELVAKKVEVIVTAGNVPAAAAKQGAPGIPIIVAAMSDAVVTGLARSLARPGGNVTGLSLVTLDLAGKRMQLLHETVPRARRLAILWYPSNPVMTEEVELTRKLAAPLGVAIDGYPIARATDLAPAFGKILASSAGGVIVTSENRLISYRSLIIEAATRQRLPSMSGWGGFVLAGGLMSYAPSFPDMFRRAAGYVDRILKGTKPADLPIQQPIKFELAINLKTAAALGITFPPSVMITAEVVIQ